MFRTRRFVREARSIFIRVHPCSSVVPSSLLRDGSAQIIRNRWCGHAGKNAPPVTLQMYSSYLIVGVSHRTGTAALRERLFADEAGQTELLAALRAAGLQQGLVLSTCDRTELHAIA